MTRYCEHTRERASCPLCLARDAFEFARPILEGARNAKGESAMSAAIRSQAIGAIEKVDAALAAIEKVVEVSYPQPEGGEVRPALTEREWADDRLLGEPGSGGMTLIVSLDPDQFPGAPAEVTCGIRPERVHAIAATLLQAMRQDGHPAAIRSDHIAMVEGSARGDDEAWKRFATILRSYFPPEEAE